MTTTEQTIQSLTQQIAHWEEKLRWARNKEERDSAFHNLTECRVRLYHFRWQVGE